MNRIPLASLHQSRTLLTNLKLALLLCFQQCNLKMTNAKSNLHSHSELSFKLLDIYDFLTSAANNS